MSKQIEALKLALDALMEATKIHASSCKCSVCRAVIVAQDALAEQPAQQKPTCKQNLQVWVISNGKGRGQFSWEPQDERYWTRMEPTIKQSLTIEQPAQQQKEGFASPGGGYVPAIPRPMPLDWKLVPRKATPEMLKAMDECAQEGYDERLYAGMASSVYMAAWDASPVMGTLPEQPAQQQEPWPEEPTGHMAGGVRPASKPLTDEQLWGNDQIMSLNADLGWHMDTIRMFARAIEAAHGIKGDA